MLRKRRAPFRGGGWGGKGRDAFSEVEGECPRYCSEYFKQGKKENLLNSGAARGKDHACTMYRNKRKGSKQTEGEEKRDSLNHREGRLLRARSRRGASGKSSEGENERNRRTARAALHLGKGSRFVNL